MNRNKKPFIVALIAVCLCMGIVLSSETYVKAQNSSSMAQAEPTGTPTVDDGGGGPRGTPPPCKPRCGGGDEESEGISFFDFVLKFFTP